MIKEFSLIETLNNINKTFPKERTIIQIALEKVLIEKLKELKSDN